MKTIVSGKVKSRPFMIFKEFEGLVDATNKPFPLFFSEPVEDGYWFMLRRIRAHYTLENGTADTVELFLTIDDRSRNQESASRVNIRELVSLTEGKEKNGIKIVPDFRRLYDQDSVITGQLFSPDLVGNYKIELMLEGRLIPDSSQFRNAVKEVM